MRLSVGLISSDCMTMLQYAMDLIAYVASDSLQVFFICNLIILVVLVNSLKSGPDDRQHNPCFYPLVTKSYDVSEGEDTVLGHDNLPGREVSIIVKEVPLSDSCWTDDEKLGTVEAWRVQDRLTVDDRLVLVESIKNDDLLRIEEVRFDGTCRENNSDENYDHVEEDQFRKRVEAFISKVNSGLRDEMMQTTTLAVHNYSIARNAH